MKADDIENNFDKLVEKMSQPINWRRMKGWKWKIAISHKSEFIHVEGVKRNEIRIDVFLAQQTISLS